MANGNVREAAKYLGIHRSKLFAMIASGDVRRPEPIAAPVNRYANKGNKAWQEMHQ